VEQYGTTRALDDELGGFVRQRAESLDPAILAAAADAEGKKKLISSQIFFYRLSQELFPGQGDAAAKLKALMALSRTIELRSWKLAGNIEGEGVAVYTAALPGPAIMSAYGPPLDTRLSGGDGTWRLNRKLAQGPDLGPGQFCIKDAQIWITLPAAAAAPSADAPLRLEYYSLP
jgi:hypothetical protein